MFSLDRSERIAVTGEGADFREALDQLVATVQAGEFRRVVFGGDSVFVPTPAALDHLADLKERFFPEARFVLGNHDEYWSVSQQMPERFEAIYGGRDGWEDIGGVRFVYLHTVTSDGSYGLDAA